MWNEILRWKSTSVWCRERPNRQVARRTFCAAFEWVLAKEKEKKTTKVCTTRTEYEKQQRGERDSAMFVRLLFNESQSIHSVNATETTIRCGGKRHCFKLFVCSLLYYCLFSSTQQRPSGALVRASAYDLPQFRKVQPSQATGKLSCLTRSE